LWCIKLTCLLPLAAGVVVVEVKDGFLLTAPEAGLVGDPPLPALFGVPLVCFADCGVFAGVTVTVSRLVACLGVIDSGRDSGGGGGVPIELARLGVLQPPAKSETKK